MGTAGWRVWCLGAAAVWSAAGCGPQISEQSQRLAENMLALSRESFSQGDTGDAIRKCLQAIETDPTNADATYMAGFLYGTRGDYADAERWLLKTLELDDRFTEARNTLGVVYLNQARYREAIEVLEQALTDLVYPSPHLVMGNLGQAYMESGDLDRAVEVLQRAVREQPRFCVGFLRLGDALARRGDDPSAALSLETAVGSEDPECGRLQPAWRLLGEVRLRLGERNPAAEAFARCEEIDPRSDDAAACAAALGRLGDATSSP